jgi:ketosteroid isomerase-like protein
MRPRRVPLLLILTMLLASPFARALPPASGSKCNSNWVNNAGGRDCEAVIMTGTGGRGPKNLDDLKLRAMLESQQTVATILGQVSSKLDRLTPGMQVPDTRATDEAAVRAASAEWARVAAAKDLEKTLSYYADDASMFPPNLPIATGSEARRKVWTQLFSTPDVAFSNAATKIEAARSGDLAYETGTFEESFRDGGGSPVRIVGKYVVVWKKQPDGQWKAILDVFNTDR